MIRRSIDKSSKNRSFNTWVVKHLIWTTSWVLLLRNSYLVPPNLTIKVKEKTCLSRLEDDLSAFLVQEAIFKEFYSYTFPSDYMNFDNFSQAMDNKLSLIEKNRMDAYFRAFDSQQKSYLTYLDYLVGKKTEQDNFVNHWGTRSTSFRIGGDGSEHVTWRYWRKRIQTVYCWSIELGAPAELRCRFIFRFYNTKNQGYLTLDEFR